MLQRLALRTARTLCPTVAVPRRPLNLSPLVGFLQQSALAPGAGSSLSVYCDQNMSRGAGKMEEAAEHGGRPFISEDECVLVRAMIAGDFQEKLAEKLQVEYARHAQLDVANTPIVLNISSCIAYCGWELLTGGRPFSYQKIRVNNVKVLITPSTVAARNRSVALANLDQGDTHAIQFEFPQTKTDIPYDKLLIAETRWEERIIEVIHTYCGDQRWAPRGRNDLLFDACPDSYGMRTFIKGLMAQAAFDCSIGVEIKLPMLRKLFACQHLSDLLSEVYERKFVASHRTGGVTCKKGGLKTQVTCSAALTNSLKEVSSRLGHSEYEAQRLRSYVDPQILVEYAHACGFHRNSMSAYKYLTNTDQGTRGRVGEGHPWMSDSDEDADDYPKAEDSDGEG